MAEEKWSIKKMLRLLMTSQTYQQSAIASEAAKQLDKPRHNYRYVQPQLSHQAIAEKRVNREYRNMEVLNSYWVGEDGNYKYFEVILADPSRKTVDTTSVMRRGKAFRGLTSSGRKARGLGRGRAKRN